VNLSAYKNFTVGRGLTYRDGYYYSKAKTHASFCTDPHRLRGLEVSGYVLKSEGHWLDCPGLLGYGSADKPATPQKYVRVQ